MIKYKCKRCCGNCSLTVEYDYYTPKACPHLFVVPEWKLISKIETFEE
jgi:hypothetical protein